MNVKEVTLRHIRRNTLRQIYDEMWRGLKRRGEIHRVACVATPATARWVLANLDAPRSIADVHGVLLSICDAKIIPWPELWPRSEMVCINIDYYVPEPKPIKAKISPQWLEVAGGHGLRREFSFLPP